MCACVYESVSQLDPTLCDRIDCGPPGSSIHGILQVRTLEWVAISFSRDLPSPGTEPRSPALKEIIHRLSPQGSLGGRAGEDPRLETNVSVPVNNDRRSLREQDTLERHLERGQREKSEG